MQIKVEKKNSSQTFLKGAMVLSISMIVVKLCGMIYKIMLTKIYSMFGDEYAGIGTGLFTNAYEIYIESIRDNNHDIILKVTDEALLSITNGIIPGMSGSPIIQDGKLVGAVTHVLVNDPTRGYGIFIENMLEVN